MKKKKKRLFRIPIIAILVILFILAFGSQITTACQTQVPYTEFIEQVKNKEVESADVNTSSGKLTYTLKDSNKDYYTNYPYSETFIENLLLNDVEVAIHESNWLVTVLQYALMPILVILIFLFLFAGSSTMDGFSVEPVNCIKVGFDDVAGLDEIKEDMKILSDMMKDEKYRRSGARIPRGVLLQGPPGNGKTLLARAFAGETGVNFIAVNACDFGSKFVGVGSDKIKKLFTTAKRNAPCVIFIDEIDSVGAKRATQSDAAGKEMNTMLTALLNQMDGFEPMDNVMVLAATNRVQDLDDALIRPGRFDRQFIINYPDKPTRRKMFELYTKNAHLDSDINIEKLVARTYGYSCSKIECVVNEAIINSVKNNHESVCYKDFEEAILQIDIKGRLKKNGERAQKEKEIVAYHEAGHAIVAYYETNKKVTNISITPTTSGAGGFTMTEAAEELCPIEDYEKEIIMLYGGRAAEVVRGGGNIGSATAGAVQDIHEATKLASAYSELKTGIDYSAFGETGVVEIMSDSQSILKAAWDKSLASVNLHWEAVRSVAEYLLKNEEMTGETLTQMLEKM